jgi:hypothetical protein
MKKQRQTRITIQSNTELTQLIINYREEEILKKRSSQSDERPPATITILKLGKILILIIRNFERRSFIYWLKKEIFPKFINWLIRRKKILI